jgi:hypothetical protein
VAWIAKRGNSRARMPGPGGGSPVLLRETSMKKRVKKLVLAKETITSLLPRVEGGATAAACATVPCTNGCPTGPIACQSNPKYYTC